MIGAAIRSCRAAATSVDSTAALMLTTSAGLSADVSSICIERRFPFIVFYLFPPVL